VAAVEHGGAAGQLLLGDLELLLPTAREEKRYDDAAEKFRRAATLLPKDAGLQRNLGDALMKLGRADEARTRPAIWRQIGARGRTSSRGSSNWQRDRLATSPLLRRASWATALAASCITSRPATSNESAVASTA
jgi:hypothetical protein